MNIWKSMTKKESLTKNNLLKVSRRGGFSDRNGISPENVEIQLKDLDMRTRVKLQNLISTFYSNVYDRDPYYERDNIQQFFRYLFENVYLHVIDARKPYIEDAVLKIIYDTILEDDYDKVLTLTEAIINYWDAYLKKNKGSVYYDNYREEYTGLSIYEEINSFFEREYVGYRFVDDIITPISDNYEISAINEALNTEYESVYEHISKANKLLADRENPDYENSIKESISAVEAICVIITGAKGGEATLGKMLKKMEDHGVVIHGALKDAFDKLYGYTSSAKGIRHAGKMDGPSATFEEAKFMLVACCAFINYITSLSSKFVKK